MAKISFIDKVKSFKQIQPNIDWQADLRQQLLIEKRTQNLLKEDFDIRASAVRGLFSFLKETQGTGFLWRPAVAFLIILGMFGFGLGGLALASRGSLPGEGLYFVKTAVEQARLALVKDAEGRAKMQGEFTDRRIQELNETMLQTISLDKKKERAELAVTQLHQQLILFKDQLPKVESEAGKERAVAVAESIIEKSGRAGEAVSNTKEIGRQEGLLTGSQIVQKIVEMSQTANKTGSQALQMVVDNKEQNESLVQKVTENIQQTEDGIKAVDDGLNNQQILAKLSNQAGIMKEQSGKAKEILSLAKKALDENNLSQAMEKTGAAKELFSSAQETIEVLTIVIESEREAFEQAHETEVETGSIESATSTEGDKTYSTEPQRLEIQSLQLLSL